MVLIENAADLLPKFSLVSIADIVVLPLYFGREGHNSNGDAIDIISAGRGEAVHCLKNIPAGIMEVVNPDKKEEGIKRKLKIDINAQLVLNLVQVDHQGWINSQFSMREDLVVLLSVL